jgi:hypothetical protein
MCLCGPRCHVCVCVSVWPVALYVVKDVCLHIPVCVRMTCVWGVGSASLRQEPYSMAGGIGDSSRGAGRGLLPSVLPPFSPF